MTFSTNFKKKKKKKKINDFPDWKNQSHFPVFAGTLQALTHKFQGYTSAADPGFPRRGTPTQMGDVNLLFGQISLKTAWKMKTIGGGGAHPEFYCVDPPLYTHWSWNIQYVLFLK